MRLYRNVASANCYKISLALAQLGKPCEVIDIDLVPYPDRPPEFLERNPGGRVPLLVTDDGFALPESGAILCLLAEGTRLFPSEARPRVEVLRWMFFEQNQVEPNIATSRYWKTLSGRPEGRESVYPLWHANGVHALQVMDAHLATNDFFAAGRYTIADIALYGYTHVCGEGDFDLGPHPNVRNWLDRVRAQQGHVPM
jgi:glutathione S-transferase